MRLRSYRKAKTRTTRNPEKAEGDSVNMRMCYDINAKEQSDPTADNSLFLDFNGTMDERIKQKKATFERFFISLLSI